MSASMQDKHDAFGSLLELTCPVHGLPLLRVSEHLDPLAKEWASTQSPPLLPSDILEARVVPVEVFAQEVCSDLEARLWHFDNFPFYPGWRGRVFACEGLQGFDCKTSSVLEELADEGQPFAVGELLLCALLLTASAAESHVVPEGREEGRGAVERDIDAVQAVATGGGWGQGQCAENVPPIEHGEHYCVECDVEVESGCCKQCLEQVDAMARRYMGRGCH